MKLLLLSLFFSSTVFIPPAHWSSPPSVLLVGFAAPSAGLGDLNQPGQLYGRAPPVLLTVP